MSYFFPVFSVKKETIHTSLKDYNEDKGIDVFKKECSRWNALVAKPCLLSCLFKSKPVYQLVADPLFQVGCSTFLFN